MMIVPHNRRNPRDRGAAPVSILLLVTLVSGAGTLLGSLDPREVRAGDTPRSHGDPPRFRVLPPAPAAALTMLGAVPHSFRTGSSNAEDHTGDDCGVAGESYVPIVGTIGAASKAWLQESLSRPGNFASGPFIGVDTVADLTDITDPIVHAAGHGVIDPTWTKCRTVKALVARLRAMADYYCNTDVSSCTLPTTPDPDTIVFIDGDLSSTPGGTFTGTLVVTGELVYSRDTSWQGLVIVAGEGRVLRTGGGSGNPSGATVMAAIDPTPDGPAKDHSDWCAAGVDGFLPSQYHTVGGGNPTVRWCTTHLRAALEHTDLDVRAK